MTEAHIECTCGRVFKSLSGARSHWRANSGHTNIYDERAVEPGPESASAEAEVIPAGDPGEGEIRALSESFLDPVLLTDQAIMGSFAHLMEQIQTLSDNDQKIQEQLNSLQSNQYEAVVTAEAGPSFNFDGWEKVPEDLRKAGLKFLGDLGAAARAFAGGGTEDSDYELLKEVIKLDREKLKERRIKRITTVMEAISDPDSQLYSIKPKKPKDPKIKKDEATRLE